MAAVLEEAEAELASGRADIAGIVRLGAFPSAATTLLPSVVTLLRQRHRRLDIEIQDGSMENRLSELRAWKLDIILIDRLGGPVIVEDARIEIAPLLVDTLHVMLPLHHALAQRRSIALADLAKEDWSLNERGSLFHRSLLEACHAEGFAPRVLSACHSIEITMGLVAAGCSISIQAGLWAPHSAARVAMRPLQPRIERHVAIATRAASGRQPAIAAVVAAIRDATAALEAVARADAASGDVGS
jgi:DNA-binding transcriptional LysR family regulator